MFADLLGFEVAHFESLLMSQKHVIRERAVHEKAYWEHEIDIINNYTKEQAIEELIVSRKVNEKITQIDNYVRRLIG